MWLERPRFLFPSIFCCVVYSVLSFHIFPNPADALDLAHSQRPRHRVGSVTFPVYHQTFTSVDDALPLDHFRKQQGRRVLDPSLATSTPFSLSSPPPPSSSNVPELHSNVVTLAKPFGQYFAVLQIGTPAKEVALIMDTGSEVMWIQCTPCSHCGQQLQEFPIFDPAKSSTYQNLPCNAEMCQGDDSILTVCTDSNACAYNVSYGDNSFSSGVLAKETLTFTIANASAAGGTASKRSSSFTLTQFVFGCGADNEGVESQFNASGLMGLDLGAYSIISQLAVDAFSYCLPNRANSVDVTGYLTFGGSSSDGIASHSASPSLQYTPMIQNNYSAYLSQFYYLNLRGVSVNGKLLDIPAAAFEVDAETGTGGTIIDSGTTLTTFVDEAYTVIIEAFENYMGASYRKLATEENSTLQLCYEVPLSEQKGAPVAPKVTLHFEGSVDMELGTDQLFYLSASDTTNNYYCVTLASAGSMKLGVKNVVGNYQQQDFLVEFDIANSRVGFAPTQCSTISNMAPSSLTLTVKPLWFFILTFSCLLLFL